MHASLFWKTLGQARQSVAPMEPGDPRNFSQMSATEVQQLATKLNMSTSPAIKPEYDDLFYMHPPTNYVLGAIFGFLIVFSVTGNLLVLIIIMRFKRMRTRTNLLLANVSAIDLLTGLFAMPFSMITALSGEWILGRTACQINGFLNALFVGASIHTLMYISIHKYFSIKNVFKSVLTTRHITAMVIATWIWGLLFGTGLLAGWTTIEYKMGTTQCGPKVPDRNNLRETSHSIVTSVSNFVIPLAVILFCYISIFWAFRRHISSLHGDSHPDSSAQERALYQQRKVAVTLIIVLVCFLICITPYIAYSTATAFAKNKAAIPRILNPLAYICVYLASCVNPVIYALRSQAFRAGYRNLFRLMCLRKQKNRLLRRAPLVESPDHTKSKSSSSGWRRFSMAIHGAIQNIGGSRETLASSVRSRQGSLVSNMIHAKPNAKGSLSEHGRRQLMKQRSSSLDAGQVLGNRDVDCLGLPAGVVDNMPTRLLAAYRRYSSTILEERSSQLANWEKNPDADSGKAESDGENHEGVEAPVPVKNRAAEVAAALSEEDKELRPLLESESKRELPQLTIDFV